MNNSKIKTREELEKMIEKEKASGKRIGFTNGCFDILHVGHVRYLSQARKHCDTLVVGLNSDASVKRLKGESRPINPQWARGEVLASLESVDLVTVFDEDTPRALIELLSPDVLFKGGDWKEDEIVGAEHVKSCGGKVIVIPFVAGYSTTGTIDRLKNIQGV